MQSNVRNIPAADTVPKTTVINMERGKLPPQAVDLEEAILGAAMIDARGLQDLFDVFTDPNVFYKDAHKAIFTAMKTLFEHGGAVDLLTVSAELKRTNSLQEAGGDFYLIHLTQKVSSSAHIEYWARIVQQKYIARMVIRFCSESFAMAYDDSVDVFDLLETVETGLGEISEMLNKGKVELSWDSALTRVLKNVETLSHNKGAMTGVATGFDKLDAHFGGWQPGDLIILGGRPGSGKTALTVAMMLGTAEAGEAVGYVSMEMGTVQLAIRSVAVNSHFHLNQLTKEGFTKQEYFTNLVGTIDAMRSLPIFIDDRPALTINEIKRKARQWKRKHGLRVLFVDYLQLADGESDNKRINVDEVARGLKNLAKELDITVIALSQLTREVEKQSPPRPRMLHLKESSGIEDAADAVCFIYRPAYYGLEPDSDRLAYDENTEFIIEKYRNGGVGTIGLWYDANKTKFTDHAPDHHNSNDNWEQKAQERTGLPTPTPHDAFGAQGYSVTDVSNNNKPDGDVPF